MKRLLNRNETQKNLATNAIVANQHSFFSCWGVRKTYNNLGLIVKELLALFVVNSNKVPNKSWINNFNKIPTNRNPQDDFLKGFLIGGILYYIIRIIFS
jgi:hypothetical protein